MHGLSTLNTHPVFVGVHQWMKCYLLIRQQQLHTEEITQLSEQHEQQLAKMKLELEGYIHVREGERERERENVCDRDISHCSYLVIGRTVQVC